MKLVLEEQIVEATAITNKGVTLEILKIYLEFEQRFKFFYLDTNYILQGYPAIKKEMHEKINEFMQIIKNLNYMVIGMSYLSPEPKEMPGLYDQLIEGIWMTIHFWFTRVSLIGRKENTIIDGLEAVHAIIYPHLTDKGKIAYKTYLESLERET